MTIKAYDVASVVYGTCTDWYKRIYKIQFNNKFQPSVDDTNLLIFGPAQENLMEYFQKNFKGKILYVSKKAINKQPGHDTGPRNTLVIFEALQPMAPWGPDSQGST